MPAIIKNKYIGFLRDLTSSLKDAQTEKELVEDLSNMEKKKSILSRISLRLDCLARKLDKEGKNDRPDNNNYNSR